MGSEMCIRDRPFPFEPPFFLFGCTCPQGSPVVDPVLASQPTGLLFLGSFFFFCFQRQTYPKGSTLPTSVLAVQPTGWFLLTVFFFFWSLFSIYLTLGFNDADSRHGFSACPGFAVHRPSIFDLVFDLAFAYLSMCLLFPYYHRSRLHRRFRPIPFVQAAEPS